MSKSGADGHGASSATHTTANAGSEAGGMLCSPGSHSTVMEVVSACKVRVDVAVGMPAFELAGPVVTVADTEEHEYFSLPATPYTVAAKQR